MKTYKILNLISTLIIIILIVLAVLVVEDVPLSWKLFPGDTVLLFPVLLLTPIILSLMSLKQKKGGYAKFILVISIIFLFLTVLISVYVYALGSAWQN